MMKITNITKAVQGINLSTGPVYIGPGETREVKMQDSEKAFVKTLPFFETGAPPKPDPLADLKKQADELGVEYDGRATANSLQEAIDAKLGE